MKKTIAILFFIFFALACEDEEFSPVPDVDVYFPVYLDDAEYFDLDAGSSDSIEGEGYAGIILYCVIRDEHYYAYDLCCPIHFEDEEHLTLVDGTLAMCPTDSAYFPLYAGEPAIEIGNDSTPTILKSYHTSISGRTLIIYND